MPPVTPPVVEPPVTPATYTPTTYSFTQQYTGSSGVISGSSGAVTGSGWGQLATGQSAPTAFYASDSGTRLVTSGTTSGIIPLAGNVTGTISGTLSTVQGSQNLVGTFSFTGTQSNGISFNYSTPAPVTITPGPLAFNYTGTWSSPTASGTGSGTLTENAGTYFTQSASGRYVLTSTFSTSAVVTDGGALTGSRSNLLPGNYTLSLVKGLVNSPSTFPTTDTGNVTLSSQGVATTSTLGGITSIMGAMTTTTTLSGGALPTLTTTGTGPISGNTDLLSAYEYPYNSSSGLSAVGRSLQASSGSGLTTASFVDSASGTVNVAVNSTGDVAYTSTPTPLTGSLMVNGVAVASTTDVSGTSTAATTFPSSLPSSGTVTLYRYGLLSGVAGANKSGSFLGLGYSGAIASLMPLGGSATLDATSGVLVTNATNTPNTYSGISVTNTGTMTTTPVSVTPPTAATYTFTQTGYSAWVTPRPPAPHLLTTTGWTERTGSWPEGTFPTYYTSTCTGDRTSCRGRFIQPAPPPAPAPAPSPAPSPGSWGRP